MCVFTNISSLPLIGVSGLQTAEGAHLTLAVWTGVDDILTSVNTEGDETTSSPASVKQTMCVSVRQNIIITNTRLLELSLVGSD